MRERICSSPGKSSSYPHHIMPLWARDEEKREKKGEKKKKEGGGKEIPHIFCLQSGLTEGEKKKEGGEESGR